MYQRFFTAVFILTFFFCALLTQAAKPPPALLKAINNADTVSADKLCADIIFSSESPADAAYANAVTSILLYLDINSEAASRAESMSDFFMGSEDKDEEYAGSLLLYLAGKITEKELTEKMKDAPPDWRATSSIAKYVKILNAGINPMKLNFCAQKYIAASEELEHGSWGRLWKSRLAVWHNSLQDKNDNPEGLEKLIVTRKADAFGGEFRTRIKMLNNLIELRLQDKGAEASTIAKKTLFDLGMAKSKLANRPYVLLLESLSGKKKSAADLYKAAKKSPELFLMASIVLFVDNLSSTPDGKINKSYLTVYLDNYLTNIKNSKEIAVSNWKHKVETWKKWCLADFAPSGGLEPLLAKHSTAVVTIGNEKGALKQAALLLEKFKYCKNLNKISVEEFRVERMLFKGRPKPDDFDFAAVNLKTYLLTLPIAAQQGEWGRFRYLKTYKKKLEYMMIQLCLPYWPSLKN